MTPEAIDIYLVGSIGVCALGALLNIILIKKRGTSATLLALAFIGLGFAIQLYRIGAPVPAVSAVVICVMCLLMVDFVMRAGRSRPGR